MTWNPEQYLRFGGHRLRPVVDLIAAIRFAAPGRVVDFGCGPGNATILLRQRWPDSELTGLDSDPAMVARARSDYPGECWIESDIAAWADNRAGDSFDLVFSNAALHWLPDHATLFPKLMSAVAPRGAFACQMPRNFAAPTHRLLRETMTDARWREKLSAYAEWEPVAEPSAYYDWLRPHANSLDVWETEYLQVFQGEDAVLEWVKGTALVSVRNALDVADYAATIILSGPATDPRRSTTGCARKWSRLAPCSG